MFKISLSNIFLLVTIASLIVALAITLRRSDVIDIVVDSSEAWELKHSVVSESRWVDRTEPPPLDAPRLHQLAQGLCSLLDASREKTGFDEWEIASLSLERLSDADNWAYVVRLEGFEYPGHLGINEICELTLLTLMDETMYFDSISCSTEIRDVLVVKTNAVDIGVSSPDKLKKLLPSGGVF